MLKRVLAGLLELVAPLHCAACTGALYEWEDGFCGGCATLIDTLPCSSGPEGCACLYGGPLAEALHRLKYEHRLEVLDALVPLLVPCLRAVAGSVDLVTAVPMAGPRLRARGFNQSALLAQAAARVLDLPFRPGVLSRVRGSPPQVGAGRSERSRQLRGAFSARAVAGLRVLVVDDVRTTGATFAEAERALREAGAVSVLTRALAQTPDG